MKRTTITHEFTVKDTNGDRETVDAEMVVEYEGNDFKIVSAKLCGWQAHETDLEDLRNEPDVLDTIQDRLDILNNVTKIGSYAH